MNNKQYIPVRLSHLLRHCSVGAIVRGPDYLMTVKDISCWKTASDDVAGSIIPYVEQVKSALGITKVLRQPPSASIDAKDRIDGSYIPALRFPSWMKCPNCQLLHYRPWRLQSLQGVPRCDGCERKSQLEQVPWILIHEDGHMADVPWHFLAHSSVINNSEQKQCAPDSSHAFLKIQDSTQGNRKFLRCDRCKASTIFDENARLPFGKSRQQPWLNVEADPSETPACIVEIHDARVHQSSSMTALVIPPESRVRKGSVIDRLYSNSSKRMTIENARTELSRKSAIKTAASEFRCSTADIEHALKEIEKGYPLFGETITQGLLLESEYQALTEQIPDMQDDEDFVTEHLTDKWKFRAKEVRTLSRVENIVSIVDQVVSVSRLKEIVVLMGFTRLGGRLVPPDITGESNWLPALEMYGEGIFFTLNRKVLEAWESNESLQERAKDLRRRYQLSGIEFDPEITVSPRFLLLHTLSHMLIRELESYAGYPAASIKERIYCSTNDKLPMAGILLYVAVPDVVGSLGGLAELAEPDRLLPLLTRVFEHAEWCSLDPVCVEHEGQGPALLNRAACHACALVPEPSCSYMNVLLDRAFVKGMVSEGIPSLLDVLVE